MGRHHIDFVSDSWGKRRWSSYCFNYCLAASESNFAKSRSGVYYDKYQYFLYGFNISIKDNMHKNENLLFRIQFSNKQELKRFFFYFAKSYQIKLDPIEKHNSEIESPEQMQHISSEDVIWALTDAANRLNYSDRKRKKLFKSMAEFI